MKLKLMAVLITIMFSSNLINVDSDIVLNDVEGRNNVIRNDVLLDEPSIEKAKNLLSSAPRAFTENRGQLENDDVRFYDQGGAVWFTDSGVWFELREYAETRGWGSEARGQGGVSGLDFDPMGRLELPETVEYKSVVLKQEFVGANLVRPVGRERLGWNNNFFYGNDSTKWCTDVPNYGEVYYENLYDGIDLRYYSNEKGLKYDFIVHPGGNDTKIKLRYNGINKLEIDKNGDFVIKTAFGDLVDKNLFIYQNYSGEKNQILGEFVLYNKFEYGFELSQDYNMDEKLIIDPLVMLEYSTYVGGNDGDSGYDICVDARGNTYVTGHTSSSDFPNTTGAYDPTYNVKEDAFIFKLNHLGSQLIYCTFIGGNNYDTARGIIIDDNESALITGYTASSNFPFTPGAHATSSNGGNDAFILKLDENGSTLIFSTFLGGSIHEDARGIALDKIGNVYVTGRTVSSDFPTTSNANDTTYNGGQYDAFITKLNYNGSTIIYSSYIGGTEHEFGYGICTDFFGNAYVTGFTRSTDFPTTFGALSTSINGENDGFAMKFSQNGSTLVYSTYLGGKNNDYGHAIIVNSSASAIITGYTRSSDFPTTGGVYDSSLNGNEDVFVLKLNYNGSAPIFSTFIGGSSTDEGHDIVMDEQENLYVVGNSFASFPTTEDAYDRVRNLTDVIMFKLSANGSNLIYSTYLGGNINDYGRGIGIDMEGSIYICGITPSIDFPTTTDAFDKTHNRLVDCFVSKFVFQPRFNITSFSLIKGQNKTKLIYTRMCPYNFRINITDSISITDLKNVYLFLDPSGVNIKLRWNRSNGKFDELHDPNDYVSIDPASTFYTKFHIWNISFKLIFNWTYPDENWHDVHVYAISNLFLARWLNITDVYKVENDLAFNGSLVVNGENYNQISNNTLVQGGEQLTWTGLKPVYEDSIDVYPPNDEFNITIWDSSGNSWSDSPVAGENFVIQTITDKITNSFGETYIINISGIPPECDNTSETFTIRIDGDNVTFSNPSPDNTSWQTTTDVIARITIRDVGGGHVNGSTIMRIISKDNGSIWEDWKLVTGLITGDQILVQDTIALENGIYNLVKWRAADTLGNGPSESEPYRILIDSQSVSFSNAKPSEEGESKTGKVEVGITIMDFTSGINASTIEYATSIDSGTTWYSWVPIPEYKNGNEIDVKLNLTFPNGTENRIKWRAFDIAGNGPTVSPEYTIKVNTWIQQYLTKVELLSPKSNSIFTTSKVTLSWSLVDKNLTGVTYDVIVDTVYPPIEIRNKSHDSESIIISGLEDLTTYYWTVIPYINDERGVCLSGIWSFTIDLKMPVPSVNLLSPKDGTRTTGPYLTFTWELDYLGTEVVNYQIIIWDLEGTTNIERDVPVTEYILDVEFNLKYFKMYYWKIVPETESVIGIESNTRTFFYDSKESPPVFKIELKVTPEILQMKPGENVNAIARVKHLGELDKDTISLSIKSPGLLIIDFLIIEPITRDIEKGGFEDFSILISVPLGTPKCELFFNIIARSDTADLEYLIRYEVNTTLTVQVQELPEPTITPDDKSGDTFLIILALVIITIIIVLVIVFALMKKKKKPTEAPISSPQFMEPAPPPPQQTLTPPQVPPEPQLQPPPQAQIMQPQETPIVPQIQQTPQVTQPTQQLEQQPTVQEPAQVTSTQQPTIQPETPQPTITPTVEPTAQPAQLTLQQEQAPPNTQQ